MNQPSQKEQPGNVLRRPEPMGAVVCAIGNSPNPLIPMTTAGLKVRKNGAIVADPETGKTTRDRVWAGGDALPSPLP